MCKAFHAGLGANDMADSTRIVSMGKVTRLNGLRFRLVLEKDQMHLK
jgi:hypothetical protein